VADSELDESAVAGDEAAGWMADLPVGSKGARIA
jgi:hypothetical protein